MKRAIEYLDDLKAARGWETDYRAHLELGWSTSKIGNYRRGTIPGVDECTQLAEELGIDPMEVISAAALERAAKMSDTEAVGRWRVRWERATAAAVGAAIALPALMSHNVCILCQILETLTQRATSIGRMTYIRGTATTATAHRETLITA